MTSLRLSLLRSFQSPQLCLCNLVPCRSQFLRIIRIHPRKRSKLQLHRLTQPILIYLLNFDVMRKFEPITFDLDRLAKLRRWCVRNCYYRWNSQGRETGSFKVIRSRVPSLADF